MYFCIYQISLFNINARYGRILFVSFNIAVLCKFVTGMSLTVVIILHVTFFLASSFPKVRASARRSMV